ncbi:MAG: PH domain-containing protein [Roseiflexus sp.]|nr:PH domain-containing protein [Roseiflexus sp.]MCS7288777.1 PH domain-containing protein [Roseiflexus sp.]MDW8147323.1 PH domain-containing protein [Roseiflexaceae bacterium]MDW8233890.1 PH domain-containing protein [Roseiflexaceae bacterium]
MTTSAHPSIRDRVFRPHPYIVGSKIVVLLAFGAGVLLAGITHAAAIAMPIAWALVILAARIAYRELTTFLVVRGDTLLLRRGLIFWREDQVPLHRVDVQTIQSLPGRLFDYGHLTITCNDRTLVVRNIGEFRRLQEEIARLQRIPAFWRSL